MAFLIANLAAAGGQAAKGKSPGLWTYFTDDAVATIDTADYFLDAIKLLQAGDFIFVSIGAAIPPVTVTDAAGFVIKNNDGTAIDSFDETVFTVTDTD